MKNCVLQCCYVFLGIILLITMFELLNCVFFSFINNRSSKFMMDFIKGTKYENALSFSVALNLKHCCFDILIIISHFALLKFFSRLRYFDDLFTKNKTDNNEEDKVLIFMSKIVPNENRLLLYTSFFNLLFLSNSFLAALILFYPTLKLRLWMYKKCSIYAPVILSAITLYLINEMVLKMLFKNATQIKYPEQLVSADFFEHLKKLHVTSYEFLQAKNKFHVNVAVEYMNGKVIFYLIGECTILSKSELTSILYHEIGHLVINYMPARTGIIFLSLLGMSIILLVLLRKSKKINMETITKYEMYFLVECLFEAFSSRMFLITTNLMQQKEELKCDSYSKNLMNPLFLAQGLIKLHLHYVNRFYISKLYSYMNCTHPPLLRRIENLLF